MKRKGRSLISFLLMLTLVLGSALTANASDTNFKTIPRQNYANTDDNGHTEVRTGDTVDFVLYAKRATDTFEIYDLTQVNLNAGSQSGVVKWNDDFQAWIDAKYKDSDPTAYALYQSPVALGWNREGATDLTKEAATVALLRALRADMESDPALMATMENYKVSYYYSDEDYKGKASEVAPDPSAEGGEEAVKVEQAVKARRFASYTSIR